MLRLREEVGGDDLVGVGVRVRVRVRLRLRLRLRVRVRRRLRLRLRLRVRLLEACLGERHHAHRWAGGRAGGDQILL